MAGLKAIRDGMAKVIKANVTATSNLKTYPMVEDQISLPALVIEPLAADFEGAFQAGMHTWDFNIMIMVTNAAGSSQGQKLLDTLIDGTHPNSIVKILDDHPEIGCGDGTFANCYGLKGYGGHYDWQKVPHIGAILKVRVITDPNE